MTEAVFYKRIYAPYLLATVRACGKSVVSSCPSLRVPWVHSVWPNGGTPSRGTPFLSFSIKFTCVNTDRHRAERRLSVKQSDRQVKKNPQLKVVQQGGGSKGVREERYGEGLTLFPGLPHFISSFRGEPNNSDTSYLKNSWAFQHSDSFKCSP